MTEREQFEAWLKTKGASNMKRNGIYVESMTRLWEECWQAARAQPAQAEAVPPTPITSGAMANQRDADRYRWLRRITVIHQQMGEQTRLGRLSTLDAAIDAALAAQGAKT